MIGVARSLGRSLVIVAAGATALIVMPERGTIGRKARTRPISYRKSVKIHV